ncbi:MAG: cupin domain-containing protein [Alphaproteobacteria bacterium]|nr:MAG: cupin domain-containing protein [Alphaproteobacteria bacterium]
MSVKSHLGEEASAPSARSIEGYAMHANERSTPSLMSTVQVENTLAYMGSLLSFPVPSGSTGGGLAVLVAYARPGSEPPPHVHHHEHEVYYLIEGEIDFFVEHENAVLRAGPGSVVFLPSGRAHALKFISPARFLTVIHALNGLEVTSEAYLRSMAIGPATSLELPENAERYATIDPSAMEAAVASAARHGVTFLQADEITARLPLMSSNAM